jgi:hypothetical protein
MPRTLAERLAEGLRREGYEEVEAKHSSRYLRYCKRGEKDSRGHRVLYFIGSSGALRRGRNVATSISLTNGLMYKRLLSYTTPPVHLSNNLGDL